MSRPDERPCLHCGLAVPATRDSRYCCFGCRVAARLLAPGGADGEPAGLVSLRTRLAAGVFLAMNVMALNFSLYARDVFGAAAAPPGGAWGELSELFGYLLLFLSTLVVVLLVPPLFRDALGDAGWRGLARPNAALLILVGVLAAFALSGWQTLAGGGRAYYETVTMVLVIVSLGAYVEARARRAATDALAGVADDLPQTVERRGGGDGEPQRVPLAQVVRGDRVRVPPGELLAVDGVVHAGRCLLDRRRLTGESATNPVGPGDGVLAGSIPLDAELWVEARGLPGDRRIDRIDDVLERARRERPPIQRLADRLAAWFTPLTVAIALAVFVMRAASGQPADGLLRGLSVLLIACPCALAIGPSLTLVGGLRAAAAEGALFRSAATFERAAALTHLRFDKTGTLTEPVSRVEGVVPAAGVDPARVDAVLAAIAAAGGSHPLARGLARHTQSVAPASAGGFRVLPARGVELEVGGVSYRLQARDPETGEDLVLYGDGVPLAELAVRDRPRDDARESLERLRGLGIDVAGLSGDRARAAARASAELGIPIESGLFPEQKLAHLERLRQGTTRVVGMVGDGVNDAPVLAAADVGFAMGSGTALSRQSGHVLLTGDRLRALPDAIERSRSTLRRLRLLLAGSFLYNGVGILLAAGGLLQPIFAAGAMVASSLLVVLIGRGAGAARDDAPAGDGLGASAAGLRPRENAT